jgi:hypothetical protein
MAKKIFINNLNTYVSRALMEELQKSNQGEDGEEVEEGAKVFGTYIDKDSSVKPDGVMKMLKVSFTLFFVTINAFYRDPNLFWP